MTEEVKSALHEAISQMVENTKKVTLTIDEAAQYSGIGRDSIRKLIAAKTSNFPYFKIASKTYINRKKLDQWLEQSSEDKIEYFT